MSLVGISWVRGTEGSERAQVRPKFFSTLDRDRRLAGGQQGQVWITTWFPTHLSLSEFTIQADPRQSLEWQ